MLSIILSVSRKRRPVHIQATLVISYYSHIVIKGTTPGVGRGKELPLSVEDGVHPNPVARGLAQMARDPLHIVGGGGGVFGGDLGGVLGGDPCWGSSR